MTHIFTRIVVEAVGPGGADAFVGGGKAEQLAAGGEQGIVAEGGIVGQAQVKTAGGAEFGHAGQDALNECMQRHGGFEHNLQSLRIVDRLEERYGAFDGLNLMFETREGILKHCSPARARELGDLGRRFIDGQRPSLEAQICNLADEIAYNNHDVDDGLRSGVLSLEQLQDVSLFARHAAEVSAEFPSIAGRRRVHETIRRVSGRKAMTMVLPGRMSRLRRPPSTSGLCCSLST